MSDLAATSCGCNSCDGGNSGCSCIIWIILILCLCGGNNGCGLSNTFGNSGCNDGSNCIIWIILILLLCGGCGNSNFGNTFGNGCGCNNSCC